MFFWNLLSTEASTSSDFGTWLMLGGAIILIVVMMVFNGRSQRKRQQEMQETLSAVKPGSKVKTIGGICGVVVEVCNEDNTFVLETGSEKFGKSYVKLDKQAIYQTDAKKETAPVEEIPVATAQEEEVVAPVEETPVFEEESVAPVIAAEAVVEEPVEESAAPTVEAVEAETEAAEATEAVVEETTESEE
jgi:preprotein translocase YajC subunit